MAAGLADAGTFFHGDGDLLDDFEAEALKGGDMHGRVGEKANALDAEVGEDLPAETDGAEDAAAAGLGTFAGAQLLMQNEATDIGRRGRRGGSDAFGVES